ncbi:uncharacterized protein CC84DRAFT_883500 [Paraphaeosphaeria sporulosa]|uniref:Uncharacterized protein n=1 Tax=Paraphaeosphaeria sporulosa TaxID=1460663 RepID=A0A177C8F2_9PLEO|nr:uncharacterized protein CC84DRAFT_883500 [Paraphaeosphaeria sporulosa]OAG04024.1 hypothetical protein CC84DRAFT_883500 [Paraphaeosphaeria sporulosa]
MGDTCSAATLFGPMQTRYRLGVVLCAKRSWISPLLSSDVQHGKSTVIFRRIGHKWSVPTLPGPGAVWNYDDNRKLSSWAMWTILHFKSKDVTRSWWDIDIIHRLLTFLRNRPKEPGDSIQAQLTVGKVSVVARSGYNKQADPVLCMYIGNSIPEWVHRYCDGLETQAVHH